MSVTISPKISRIIDVPVTTGGNLTIESGTFTIGSGVPADDYTMYRINSSSTLSSDLDIVINGTPKKNTRIFISWEATVTLGGNDITLFGGTVPAGFEAIDWYAVCTYDGSAWQNVLMPSFLAASFIQSSHVATGAITASKIGAEAVTVDKMEDLTSTYILVGNASNRPTAVAVTGDVTISNTGVTTIGASKVLNAMIDTMDASKLTGTVAAARIADDSLSSNKLSDIGLLDSKYSDTGTTAVTTEEELYSYTLPAGTIANDGEGIRVTAYGSFAGNANTKTIEFRFAGNAYVGNAVTSAPNGVDFKAEFQVLRSGATSAVGYGDLTVGAVSQGIDTSKAGVTWANTNDVTIAGQNGTAAANDIVLSMVIVEQIR